MLLEHWLYCILHVHLDQLGKKHWLNIHEEMYVK